MCIYYKNNTQYVHKNCRMEDIMKRTKEKNLISKILAVVLSAVFFCSALSTAVFAVNGDDDSSSETDTSTSSSTVDESGSTTPSGESSDNSSDNSSEPTSDNSSGSSSNNSSSDSSGESSNNSSQNPSPTTPTAPQTPNNSLAVGTIFTVGNYMYMVKGPDTVSLKGFAKNVSLSTVTVKNTVTYNGVTYKVIKIGTGAFKGENGIKKVILSQNVTDVGKQSFKQCKNLNKVRMKLNVSIIRQGALRDCPKLKTINITSTVLKDIRENVFKNIKSGAVVNVMNDPVRKLVKAAAPSNVTVNMM